MFLYTADKEYHDKLNNSKLGFLSKERRLYYILHDLNYKGQKISLAIPARSNIPLACLESGRGIKTMETKGAKSYGVSGWHITKAIPFFSELFSYQKVSANLQMEASIAKQNSKKIRETAQQTLDEYAAGQKIENGISFDRALEIATELQAKLQVPRRRVLANSQADNVPVKSLIPIQPLTCIKPNFTEATVKVDGKEVTLRRSTDNPLSIVNTKDNKEFYIANINGTGKLLAVDAVKVEKINNISYITEVSKELKEKIDKYLMQTNMQVNPITQRVQQQASQITNKNKHRNKEEHQ